MNLLYSKPIIALKKIAVDIIASNFVGWTIRRIYNNAIPHNDKKVYTDNDSITNKIVSYIFFNVYESSEIRYINQYLNTNYPVVELGSSLGIVAMQIASKTAQQIYSVEANPNLIPIIKNNLKKNNIKNCSVNNYIIANSEQQFFFEPGNDNTTGYISTNRSEKSIAIESVSLSNFLQQNHISQYVLICDIEGAEIFIVKEDPNSLDNCRQIIIELHDTTYQNRRFSIDELALMIKQLGFNEKAAYAGNVVFER